VLTIKEYQVFDKKLNNVDINQMHSVTINVDSEHENLGGILEMGYFSAAPLGIDEKSIIRSILSVMVMVIGSSRTLKKTLTNLDSQANQDPLTGLNNRRYFNDFLEKEIERSRRHSHEFCSLMLDLDDFKKINDSHGHLCGDKVLKDIANILKNKIRRGDMVARLGGDEFAIVLPETNMKGAHFVAEEILFAIANYQLPDLIDIQVTASIGIINYPSHSASQTDLLSKVDIALYQAKANGRNTVCAFGSKAHDKISAI
jgi:diguanylate cyclase (GGDEF)-like protein